MNDLEQALRETAEQAANDQVAEGGSPVFDIPQAEGSAVTAEALEETPDTEIVPDVAPVTVEPVAEPAVEEVPAEFVIPQNWSEEDVSLYNASDESSQKFIQNKVHNLEAGHTKRLEEISDQVTLAENILQALQPVNHQMQQHALAPDQTVAQLVQAFGQYEALTQNWNTDPLGTIQQFLGQLPADQQQSILENLGGDSIDPYEVRQAPAGPSAHEQALNQRITGIENSLQSSQTANVQSHLTAFTEAKDADGNLTHPHFEKVREHMGLLMAHAGNARKDLPMEDAYIQATRANPETWALLEKEQVATGEAKRKASVAKATSTQPAKMPETVPVNGQSTDAVTLTGKAAIRAEAFKLAGVPLP